ncbi:Serine hydroxymethyltransferase, cytosolic [Hypoxylon texense]
MTSRIRIGIAGGSLAGITVAIALLKHPRLDVEVYEAAPNFTERDAGIGLSPLALEALEDTIPSAVDFLKTQAGAVEYVWLGEGASMRHAIVENRTMVHCIIAMVDKDLSSDRERVVTRQVLEDALSASWYEGSVAKGMIELILDQDPKGYAEWAHKFTPAYENNRVCIVGDAAHTPSP